ncbi:MAG: 2'-5' RNA ligase family protein [Rhodoferax sp.]
MRSTDRLFLAVYPDAATALCLAALAAGWRERLGLRGKPLQAQRLHATVAYLGDFGHWPQQRIVQIEQALGAAGGAIPLAPFAVAFAQVHSFAGRARNRPFVLSGGETQGLQALHQWAMAALKAGDGLGAVGDALVAAADAKPYVPHLTLLYDDAWVAPQPVEPLPWQAQGLALMHSALGQSRHTQLAYWPLQGGGDTRNPD